MTVPATENFAILTRHEDGSSSRTNGVFSSNTGPIGGGKTATAANALSYKLYYLSCLISPQDFFDLMPNHPIIVGLLSVFKYKVETTSYTYLESIVNASPYFNEHFPRNPKKTKSLEFPHNIRVLHGGRQEDLIGENLLYLTLDEANFRMKSRATGEDSAYEVYNAALRRMESRYMDERIVPPWLLIIVSSKRHESDFTAARVEESKNDPHVHVSDYPLWELKKSRYKGCTWFRVQVGDGMRPSRILGDDEPPDADLKVLSVPDKHRPAFERDVDDALNEIGGIATKGTRPFIGHYEIIENAIDPARRHPFWQESIYSDFRERDPIEDYLDRLQLTRVSAGLRMPLVNPHIERYFHVDIGLTGDCLALAMGHPAGYKVVERIDQEGLVYKTEDTLVYIDFVLQIVPKGEIDLEAVRILIMFLRNNLGFMIGGVTYDGFQSSDSIQMLVKAGLPAHRLSMDRDTGPYSVLRSCLIEDRISYYKYPVLLKELRHLVLDRIKGKVDHPKKNPDGTKGCFSGDTLIKLLDGTSISLKEMANNQDCEYFVYSYDTDVTVGCAIKPRLTEQNAETVIVELEDGQEICCTPDHRFLLRDGTYREAGNLSPGDSLMSLYTKVSNKDGMSGYELYRSPATGRWHFTHRMVGWWKYGSRYKGNQYGDGVLHHEKGKLNNDPRYLILMSQKEHARAHAQDLIERRSDPVFEKRRRDAAVTYARSNEGREKSRRNLQRLHRDAEFAEMNAKRAARLGKVTGPRNLTRYNKSDEHRRKASEIGKKTIQYAIDATRGPRPHYRGSKNPYARKDITFDSILQAFHECSTQRELCKKLSCTQKVVYRVLREQGFTWGSFSATYNHRVKSVRRGLRQDVYDISVPGPQNFALDAGVFVHNSKDCADAVAGVAFQCITLNAAPRDYSPPGVPDTGEEVDTESQRLSQLSTHRGLMKHLYGVSVPDVEDMSWVISDANPATVKAMKNFNMFPGGRYGIW